MIPSVSRRRGRRAPFSLRPVVVCLLLAGACKSGEPPEVPPAASVQSKAGETGTRAKGDEGDKQATRNEPMPVAATAPTAIEGAGKKTRSHGRMPSQGASGGAVRGGQAGLGVGHIPSTPMPVARRAWGRGKPPTAALVPGDAFGAESYAPIVDNPLLAVKEHPLSTFSADVDTASFSNARRFLRDGQLPPKDSIRVEEWLNYFSYPYAPPTGDAPVAIHTEVSSCPWAPAHRLVRIGIKARPITQATTPPRNLVFLVDVSGSMQPEDKLPLLKRGLGLLARTLRPEDSVAIVVYAGASGLALPATSGAHTDHILDSLQALDAGGSTNGGDGIRLAYAVAQEHFKKGGINRVILATDGDFNVGTTSEGELQRLIEDERKSGVFLTVLGFGDGNVKDSTMEMLADKGNGNYAYIDSVSEARRVLVREAGATLVTVAKDVKLQVEFNPARVQSYRLVGYENRLLAKEDFNDDKKDAGDMGAGHAVTALYEVVPVGAKAPKGGVDPLKYQAPAVLTEASARGELLTVAVRYKPPSGSESTKMTEVVVDSSVPFASASADQRFASAVAHFALVLRESKTLEGQGLADSRRLALAALGDRAPEDRRELLAMIDKARALRSNGGVIAQ